MDASPFARLHRLAERDALHGTRLTASDLIDLGRLLAYAEAAHPKGRTCAWASYHTEGGVRLTGAYDAWVAFPKGRTCKAADAALGRGG